MFVPEEREREREGGGHRERERQIDGNNARIIRGCSELRIKRVRRDSVNLNSATL